MERAAHYVLVAGYALLVVELLPAGVVLALAYALLLVGYFILTRW